MMVKEKKTSPHKPQQLNFDLTSGGSQILVLQSLLTPLPPSLSFTPLPPLATPLLPLLSPLLPNTMANPTPRIANVVHDPYFLERPESNPDTHVAKFEFTCATNDVPIAKF